MRKTLLIHLLPISAIIFSFAIARANIAPVATDLSTVKPVEPYTLPSLTLYLDAGHAQAAQGKIVAWADKKSGLRFAPQKEAPALSVNAKRVSVISFNGHQPLVAKIQNYNLTKPNEFTVFVVAATKSQVSNDLLGMGNCETNRFNIHFPYEGSLHFQYGDPGVDAYTHDLPPSLAGDLHVYAFRRKDNSFQAVVFGKGGFSEQQPYNTKPNVAGFQTFMIGGGPCGNPFSGTIAGILTFSQFLDDANFKSVASYLAGKYKTAGT